MRAFTIRLQLVSNPRIVYGINSLALNPISAKNKGQTRMRKWGGFIRGRNSPEKFLSPGIGDPRKIKIFPRVSPGNNFLLNSPMIKRIFSNFSATKASCFMRSYIF